MNFLKWGKLGLGIKRWILLSIIGLIVFSSSIVLFFCDSRWDLGFFPRTGLFLLGIAIMVIGIHSMMKSIVTTVYSHKNLPVLDGDKFNNIFYKEKILPKKPKIVAIGGGTGLSTMLRGLREQTANITAIVTVADDGGGSGVLRKELHMLPPGDIRNCILALADTEPTMEKVLQYRFKEGSLSGQSFGNLFIAAMNDIYGDFNLAVKEMSNVLAVKGRVLPMTSQEVSLVGKLEDGTVVRGESNIPEYSKEKDSPIESVWLEPERPRPLEEALKAIEDADCIVFGPGSLYTSIMPNLLVSDIVEKIKESSVPRVYIGNIMTQPGETDNYSFTDHIESIIKHSSEGIIDYAVANIGQVESDILEKYRQDGADRIVLRKKDECWLKQKNIRAIKEELVCYGEDNIRHNSERLGHIVMDIALKSQLKRKKNRGGV